ncbi:MAG: cysteine hydrolase [Butyricicoccus pullicaecorum]|nr:cysteine hydrolase [Butyricicoccus pullicaecorum]
MKRLLAIIDYQNDFVSGSLGFPNADKLDLGIAELAQKYLAQGDPILITYDTHDTDYLETREGKALPIPHCISKTEGWQLYGKTQNCIAGTCAPKQIFPICKTTFGIAPEDLIKLKTQIGSVDEILIVGLVSNICVMANTCTLQAAWPSAQIVVDASLCASFDAALHEKTLDVMTGMQVKVIHRAEKP